MNKEKMRLIASCACLVVSLLLLAGTTIAYFSDTKQVTNTMTAGNVTIELSESAVKKENGNLVADSSRPRVLGGADATVHNYGKIYPGMTVCKDPTIKNTGDEAAWVAAKITITDGSGDLHDLIGYGSSYEGIDIKELLSGGILDEGAHSGPWNGMENVRYTDTWAIVQKADVYSGTYEFYVFFLDTLAKDESVVLFDTLAIPEDWTGQEMQKLGELTIHVQAYAVQTFDLESCFEAMTRAFANHFVF